MTDLTLIKQTAYLVESHFFDEIMPLLEKKYKGSSCIYLLLLSGERNPDKIIEKGSLVNKEELENIINMFLEIEVLSKTADILYLKRRIGVSEYTVSIADLNQEEIKENESKLAEILEKPIKGWNVNTCLEYFKSLYFANNSFKLKEVITGKERGNISAMIDEYGTENVKSSMEYAITNWDKLFNQKKEYANIISFYTKRSDILAEMRATSNIKTKQNQTKLGDF